MNPPDVPGRARRFKGAQHGQHRRGTDPGTEQNNRSIARRQDEIAARRGYADDIADPDTARDIGARRAIGRALDADAIARGARRAGQRVTAQQRGRLGLRAQLHDDENWPGAPGDRGLPSAASSHSDVTVPLSRFLSTTRNRRNPVHAGFGLAAGPRPGLPVAPSVWASNAVNDERQPALSAGMRSACASRSAGWPGLYSSALISATVIAPGPCFTRTISSPAPISPSSRTRK